LLENERHYGEILDSLKQMKILHELQVHVEMELDEVFFFLFVLTDLNSCDLLDDSRFSMQARRYSAKERAPANGTK
jgi:hypothetical protein